MENTGDWLGNAVGNLRKSLSFSSSPAKKSATMPGREIAFTDTLFAPTSGHSEEEIRRIRKESRSADTTDIDNMNYQILRQAGASPEITEYVLSMIKRNRYGKGYRDWETDRKSTRLNSSHRSLSRMPSSA